MLNPSTATAKQDDRTTKKLTKITKDNGYRHYKIRNLFAVRTPYPKKLIEWLRMEDKAVRKSKQTTPITYDNTSGDNRIVSRNGKAPWLRDLKNASKIVLAWGGDGSKTEIRDRRDEVLRHLQNERNRLGWAYRDKLYYMKTTKKGDPRHPLYLPFKYAKFKLWKNRSHSEKKKLNVY